MRPPVRCRSQFIERRGCCTAVGRCKPVPHAQNASLTHFNASARTATLTCLPGFRFSNGLASKQITCNQDSSWNVLEPCKRRLRTLRIRLVLHVCIEFAGTLDKLTESNYTVRQKKRNQFSVVCIFLMLDRNL